MTTEYLTVRRRVEMNPSLQYVNNGFEKDLTDSNTDHRGLSVSFGQSLPADRNNNLGDSLKDTAKERSLSLYTSLPILATKTATKKEMFSSLFQVKNVSAMIKSTFKRREEKVHRLLWVTILIYVTLLVVSNGMPTVLLLFVQKVYHLRPNSFMVRTKTFLFVIN